MGPLLGILLLIILFSFIYRYFGNQNLDLEEEREEIKANLETAIEDLEQLDEVIEGAEEKKANSVSKLRLLKTRVSRRKLALKKTIDKVKIESDENWDYRKVQARRTLETTRKISENLELPEIQLKKCQ